MIAIDQIRLLDDRATKIYEAFDISNARIQYAELSLREQDPEFWCQEKSILDEHNKQVSTLTKKIELCDECEEALNHLLFTYEFVQDAIEDEEYEESYGNDLDTAYNDAVTAIEKAEFSRMLSDETDNMPCVLTINAGAGGTEAQDWAEMLSRMYLLYCKNNGWKTTITNENTGNDIKIGIKSRSIKVEGDFAYGLLKSEIGVHRLVRVSPYNAQGKRMTSFASVFVTPLIDDTIEIELDESKLSYDYFRSSGAGGQNVNKVNSGVRARYWYTDPDTGETEEILVENTETRDQPKNKENARRILKSILYDKEMQRKRVKELETRGKQKKIEWGAQIRSYVFDDKRVKDHRTNYEDRNVDSVMNGNIDEFVKAYLMSCSVDD